jgi:hypothetical protein
MSLFLAPNLYMQLKKSRVGINAIDKYEMELLSTTALAFCELQSCLANQNNSKMREKNEKS